MAAGYKTTRHGGVRWEAGMHEHVAPRCEKGPLFSQRLCITQSDTAIRAAQETNVFTVVTGIRWGGGRKRWQEAMAECSFEVALPDLGSSGGLD